MIGLGFSRYTSVTFTRRFFSYMSIKNGVSQQKDRTALIPFSSRLVEGRALNEDVWSIFKCVQTMFFSLVHN